MSNFSLKNIVKRYGKITAVDDLSLDVKDGELVTFLGPSGCGKTTTLRTIAGFLKPESGSVYIGERNITDIPPEKRGIGLVFQNYALWPHMTVSQNLAFGLQMKKYSANKIKEKVGEGLSIVKLEGYGNRYPRELSGGQQQRVALARAIVLEPDILLLDEPLSNLDALLREQVRFEIAQIHKRFGITTVYVTHDQTEAMVISDRIIILNKGKIVQQGKPEDIYSKPVNKFVAGFMGSASFIEGKVDDFSKDYTIVRTADGLKISGFGKGLKKGDDVVVVVRPESVSFLQEHEEPGPVKGQVYSNARINRATYIGELIDYQIKLNDYSLRAKGDVSGRRTEGESVRIYLDPDKIPILRN